MACNVLDRLLRWFKAAILGRPTRSCNLHVDCDAADIRVRQTSYISWNVTAEHCYDKNCSLCN